jgi:site-specific DNA-adenine methylase
MQASGKESLLERAVQFYYINRTVWGGRVVYDPNRESRLYFSNPQGWDNLEKKLGLLEQVSEKLQGVTITCLSFEECLADADEETFIYCDPPYMRDTNCHPTDKLYDKSFGAESHRRLAQLLRATRAKVMLSYDDCPEARALYAAPGWHAEELSWKYCGRYARTKEAKANGVKERKVTGNELLVLNYGRYPEALRERPRQLAKLIRGTGIALPGKEVSRG